MEYLIHYIWKHKIFPADALCSVDGQSISVIDSGIRNDNAGPDFFNAKVRIGDTMWVGNVEIHDKSSDWFRHGHDKDKAYDNVILHVCKVCDADIFRSDGEKIPQLTLDVPDYVRSNYNVLKAAEVSPACYSVLPLLSSLVKHSWMSALYVERLKERTSLVMDRLGRIGNNWEDAFFVSIARNFGFGLNGDTFERWALSMPYRQIDKHRDNLMQIESIMFGMAGLLEGMYEDDYYCRLKNEYEYLKHKFQLCEVDGLQWKLLRTRPGNFPYVRIAQLAYLYFNERSLFSRILECKNLEEIYEILKVETSEYWQTHYTFKCASPRKLKSMSRASINLIVINTVAPFLYAYGLFKDEQLLCDRACSLLESLPAEDNYIIRNWANAGVVPESAADSQALIQLTREYCEKRKCFYCRFGYEFLKCRYV